MTISSLRPLISELAQTCQEHTYAWMVTEQPGVDEIKLSLPEIVAVYTQTAALLAADWYNNEDADSSYHAVPIDGIADERLDNTAHWVHAGPQTPENRMRVAAHSLVFDAARNTVYGNAQEEGVAVVRYEYADSCDECVARATTSPRARRSRSDDIATDFHHSCEGMYIPVRTGVWEPPHYAREWGSLVKSAREAGFESPDDIASWLKSH